MSPLLPSAAPDSIVISGIAIELPITGSWEKGEMHNGLTSGGRNFKILLNVLYDPQR